MKQALALKEQPRVIHNHRDRRTFSPRFKIEVVERILANEADIRHVSDKKGIPIDPGNIQIWIDRYKLGKLAARGRKFYMRDVKPKAEPAPITTVSAPQGFQVDISQFHELKVKVLEMENLMLKARVAGQGTPNNLDALLNKVLT